MKRQTTERANAGKNEPVRWDSKSTGNGQGANPARQYRLALIPRQLEEFRT
jgi:hypothetical protein